MGTRNSAPRFFHSPGHFGPVLRLVGAICCLGFMQLGWISLLTAAERKWDSPRTEPIEQPVMEYFAETVPFSHLGADFGRMGPGQDEIVWRDGMVCVAQPKMGWAGMWHSLSGPSDDSGRWLSFSQCYPPFIQPPFQPRCTAIVVHARGTGPLKIELKSPDGRLLWQRQGNLKTPDRIRPFRIPCPTDELKQAKLLSWVVEPSTEICIDSLQLEIAYPKVPYSQQVFLQSYAKLARSFDERSGLVQDKCHVPSGKFDSIPSSGMFCLATAAAATMEIVEHDEAERILRQVHGTVNNIPTARGILPHFVSRQAGEYRIAPGTEFSTVDSSLYYHAMLLAVQMLGDQQTLAELTDAIGRMEFESLVTEQGHIRHGLRDDGSTLIESTWDGWGGESALVWLTGTMTGRLDSHTVRMDRSGRVFRGVGFIAEIQSLFYPQFSNRQPDQVTQVSWIDARRKLFQQQRAYFDKRTAAGRMGVFGLSAGEAFRSEGYVANGTEDQDISLIHPHYMLMAWQHWNRPEEFYTVARQMEQVGLFPPWGLVENVTADLKEYLAFNGSLNASFEALSAYHMWAAANGQEDAIYAAARRATPLRQAILAIYP